jgi:hypothetical protein
VERPLLAQSGRSYANTVQLFLLCGRRGTCRRRVLSSVVRAEVATQRSFSAVVLIAVMVDRRAVTFRTLAVAAMIVLVLAPEALVHPSFQSLGA